MGSKPNGKSARIDSWQPKPGNRPKISVFTGAHARKLKDMERQVESLNEKKARLETQLTKIQSELERVDMKIGEVVAPDWVEIIAKPIAKELAMVFPDVETDVLHVGNGVTIVLSKKDVPVEDRLVGKGSKTISLVPVDLHDESKAIGVRDYSKRLDGFPEGSLGAIQGLCYPVKEVAGSDDIGSLLQFLK
jgi:hypothetical protein